MAIEELFQFLLAPTAQVGIIIGLAEIVKRLEIMDTKFIPIVDLILGIIAGVLVYGHIAQYGFIKGLVIGVALGLSACGLFSSIKNVTQI